MAYMPDPGGHLTNLINGHHAAMLHAQDPGVTAMHAKLLAALTAHQAKTQQGQPQGGPGGPVAEPAMPNQAQGDAEGAAGASALLAALFPPRQVTPQNAVNPAVLAGGGYAGGPLHQPQAPLNPILAALLGHGAVGG